MSGTFPLNVIAAACASQAKWNIPASVCLAQWALESGYGLHLSGKNNPFGIKATAGQAATIRTTGEDIDGHDVTIQARFRDFATIAEAFDEHGKLLATAGAYAAARAVRTDAKAFARALTGRYATDHLYDEKLIAIMDQHNLYGYDDVTRIQPVTREPPVIAVKKPKATAKTGAIAAGATAAAGGVGAAVASHPSANHAWVFILVAALIALTVFLVLHFKKKGS